MSDLLIRYPTGWTLAVVPDVERGDRIAAELVTLGVPRESIAVIAGADAPAQLRRLGASSGVLARLRRSVQFMTMDQLPDLFVYEAAVTDGRTLLGAKVPGSRNAEAVAIMRRHGAHFINRFGALMTTEVEPWRGTMPRIPQYMQR